MTPERIDHRRPHPVLHRPHEYELTELSYCIDRVDDSRSYVDMTLRKDGCIERLRFWQPRQLKIEEGFPVATGGMVFYDLSADGLENVGVEVADFEATPGAITFFARSVERIPPRIP